MRHQKTSIGLKAMLRSSDLRLTVFSEVDKWRAKHEISGEKRNQIGKLKREEERCGT
jgi:hypothetical protein